MAEATKGKPKAGRNQQQLYILGGIIAVAVIIAAGAIFFSNARGAVNAPEVADFGDLQVERLADGGFVIGDPEAPITIVEFSDFQCPHCQDYHSTVSRLVENHVLTGEARFEYRFFASVDRSGLTARYVECAAEEDINLFWPAHETMFQLTSRGFNNETGRVFARELGLEYGDLLSCISDANQFQIDTQLGSRLGVNGTPGVQMRLGDGSPQWITFNGQRYDRGGPPYAALAGVIASAQ